VRVVREQRSDEMPTVVFNVTTRTAACATPVTWADVETSRVQVRAPPGMRSVARSRRASPTWPTRHARPPDLAAVRALPV